MDPFLLLWILSGRKDLDVIHRQLFHLLNQCFLLPWAESACANTLYFLSFKAIMTHHPMFLPAASKVILSPASDSVVRIQRLQENLARLPSQGPLKNSSSLLPVHTVFGYSSTKCFQTGTSAPCSRSHSVAPFFPSCTIVLHKPWLKMFKKVKSI